VKNRPTVACIFSINTYGPVTADRHVIVHGSIGTHTLCRPFFLSTGEDFPLNFLLKNTKENQQLHISVSNLKVTKILMKFFHNRLGIVPELAGFLWCTDEFG